VMTGQPAESRMTASFDSRTHQIWRSTGFNTNFGKDLATVALCKDGAAPIDYVLKTRPLAAAPSTVTAQAKCPAGRIIASGGVAVGGDLSQVHVSGSYPVEAKEAWKATVVNDSGGARSFKIHAECMPSDAGLTYTQGRFTTGPTATGFDLDTPCPTSASVPLGGGAKWSGDQSEVHLASSGPIDASGGVATIPDVTWRVGTNNDAGGSKTVTGYTICTPA
jgi:hypothetical protein